MLLFVKDVTQTVHVRALPPLAPIASLSGSPLMAGPAASSRPGASPFAPVYGSGEFVPDRARVCVCGQHVHVHRMSLLACAGACVGNGSTQRVVLMVCVVGVWLCCGIKHCCIIPPDDTDDNVLVTSTSAFMGMYTQGLHTW